MTWPLKQPNYQMLPEMLDHAPCERLAPRTRIVACFFLATLATSVYAFRPAASVASTGGGDTFTETDARIVSSGAFAIPPLLSALHSPDSLAVHSRADLIINDAVPGIAYVVASMLALFSILRWREWRARKKSEKNEKAMEKSNAEIDVVARKLKQRLPDNRVARDRISGMGPRNKSKPMDTAPSSPFSTHRQPNLTKVLLVEDNREFRTSLSNLLCRYYSILESAELDEALRIARVSRPSLIILGVQPSKKESIAFCRKLKSDASLWHIPILLLLPKKSNGEYMQLIKATDDHIVLPLRPAELMVSVENMVDVRRYLKQGGLKRPVIHADDSTTQISDTMFLEAVHTVVENNLSNSLFGLETLAQEVNVSIRQLHGRLRKLTRLSPAGFIRTKRLKQAADLLKAGGTSVQEVAKNVGFHSPEYFHRVFRQAFGVSPAEYQDTPRE